MSKLLQLVFPDPAAVLSVDDDPGTDSYYRLWTEVCIGTSDAGGMVTWRPPMSNDALIAAPLTLRDAVKAARKLQLLLSAVAGCLESDWIGGLLALSGPTRRFLTSQGCAVLDRLVRAPPPPTPPQPLRPPRSD